MQSTPARFILTAQCDTRLGTLDAITHFLYERQCFINEVHSFDDCHSKRSFIRAEFKNREEAPFSLSDLQEQFTTKADEFGMHWQITDAQKPLKTVIMVSKFDHCLNDLLYRYRTHDLNIEIAAILSNHPDLKPLADIHNIPYHHLPITKDTKPEQEAQVLDIFDKSGADLLILARYMQVLSNDLCAKLSGRAINIHHSLLPGFKGAKPYHQAFHKGVKLVGATAHFVSEDLDEGPIITQGVEAVDHTHTPERMIAKGRDIEALTLARAVRMYSEQRVFKNGDKTVVFPQG